MRTKCPQKIGLVCLESREEIIHIHTAFIHIVMTSVRSANCNTQVLRLRICIGPLQIFFKPGSRWALQDDKFYLGKRLGSGSFGQVFLAKNRRGKELAVKVESLGDD